MKGRGWYGVRRQAADEAKRQGISGEGLMQHGGWTDTQVPDAIYADQEAEYARAEAAAVRAEIRGESVSASPGSLPKVDPTWTPETTTANLVRVRRRKSLISQVFQWAWVELNYRPHAYQACALTT